jgi:hypothetical protein
MAGRRAIARGEDVPLAGGRPIRGTQHEVVRSACASLADIDELSTGESLDADVSVVVGPQIGSAGRLKLETDETAPIVGRALTEGSKRSGRGRLVRLRERAVKLEERRRPRCSGRARVALRALRSRRARVAVRALRSGRARVAVRALRSGRACVAVRALRSGRARVALRALGSPGNPSRR